MIQKILDALPRSSSDASRISLTVKGALSYAIPVAVLVFQLLGITEVGQAELQDIVDKAEAVVFAGGVLVSTIITAYGAVRRVWNKIRK